MIVGACGFGSTGSSAISDYLLEYGEDYVQVLDNIEFTWVSGVDGLIDLQYHLSNAHAVTMDSIVAIDRYIKRAEESLREYRKYAKIPEDVFMKSTYEFINSITSVEWDWYVGMPKNFFKKVLELYILRNRVIPRIEKILQRKISCYPMERVRLGYNATDFEQKAKKHVKELLTAMGADFSKIIVMDQPFAGNNPQACFNFFEDPFAVVSDRDPRDNYVFAKTRLLGKSFAHLMPTDNVEDFIAFYKGIRENQPYKQENKRVMSIHFEDMVYDYENTTSKLRRFLHLPDNPNPRTIFDPDISISNTQVFKRYPQFSKDIEKIEKELEEYLFDFDKFGVKDITGPMFVGRSPKNKH